MTQREPSITELYRMFTDHDGRLSKLETWKIAEDAAKTALEKYKRDEQSSAELGKRSKLWDALLPFIGLAGAFIAAYAAAKGIKL